MLQHSFRCLLVSLALSTLTLSGQDRVRFTYDSGEQIWTLENDLVRLRLHLSPAGNFEVESFTLASAGDAWVPDSRHGSAPIQVQVGQDFVNENSQFRLVTHSVAPAARGGRRQSIVLEELTGKGRFIADWEMHPGHPVVRYRVRYLNRSFIRRTIRGVNLIPWNFAGEGRSFTVLKVNQWSNQGVDGNFEPMLTRFPANSAATSTSLYAGAHGQQCAYLSVRSANDGGLFLGWEFDGRVRAVAEREPESRSLRFSAFIEGLNQNVEAGGVFNMPWAFLGLFHGDFDEGAFRTHRYVEAVLAPPVPDQSFPYVIWDSWKYQKDIDEVTLRQNAVLAAQLGVEVFVVDLGWARMLGEWTSDPVKFPSGMKSLSDFVHGLGMKFGLHFAFAEAVEVAPVLQANPDWLSTGRYGYFDNSYSLCLSNRATRDWVVNAALHMIDEYGVDWILQDGENMVKECTKSTHAHDPLNSNYDNAVNGLNYVVSTVRLRRPRVHWENCEDGGNMMTYQMVRNYVTSIAADDSGELTTRQAVYGVTYPFPPRYSDRYYPYEQTYKYVTRSYMFGGPWILMNRLPALTEPDFQLLAEEIALYKRLRLRIRDGKVLHLSARPDGRINDAIGSYHAETDTAIAFAYRSESNVSGFVARFRDLNPTGTYRVHFQESSRVIRLTGKQLAEIGVRIPLPDLYFSEIAYIEPSN